MQKIADSRNPCEGGMGVDVGGIAVGEGGGGVGTGIGVGAA